MPIKSKSKTTKKRTCWLFTKNISHLRKELGLMLNQVNIHFPIMTSKKMIHLLRHGKQVHRGDDGAVLFWRMKDNRQQYFLYCPHLSDSKWTKSMAGGGGNNRRYQYCTDDSGVIVHLRALQGHSGRNLFGLILQDNVVIQSEYFHHIYHVGCAINLQSIINSRSIPGGQNLSNRQTAFFLSVDPMDKNHKDPDTTDLSVPRHAQYMHTAWKRHQDAV